MAAAANEDDTVSRRRLLNGNLSESFSQLKSQFEESVGGLRDCVEDTSEKIEKKMKFLKEEVEIRVESIKIDLDILAESIVSKFNDELSSYWSVYKNEAKEYERELEILKDENTILEAQADIYFNEYQTKIEQINELVSNLSIFTSQIEFISSEKKLDSKCIGYLSNSVENNKLVKRIKQNKARIIEIDSFPTDVYALQRTVDDEEVPNASKDILFVCDYGSVKVYDADFNVTRTVQRINAKDISPTCITSNRTDRIYIADCNEQSIIMCDFDFKFIKQTGSNGDLVGLFDNISQLEYYSQELYVCDCYNQRIQCFDAKELEFLKSHQLDYEPNQFKICSNDIACVMGQSVLFFYDLNFFTLLRKHDHAGDCSIGLINSYFIYELSYETNKLRFYSLHNGECLYDLVDELASLEPVENDDRRHLVQFNNKLVVSLSAGKLVVF